jgi:hypothetical protein
VTVLFEMSRPLNWFEQRYNDRLGDNGLTIYAYQTAVVADRVPVQTLPNWLAKSRDSGRCSSTDESVEEVWINEPSRVFVARGGRHELTSVFLTAEQLRELVERMLSTSGRRLDISQPFVDAMLPGGHRLHVVLDGISRGFAAVNIRKFVAKARSLDDLVTLGTLDPQGAEFLRASVLAGLNIVVSGGTQAGKPANSQYTYWA